MDQHNSVAGFYRVIYWLPSMVFLLLEQLTLLLSISSALILTTSDVQGRTIWSRSLFSGPTNPIYWNFHRSILTQIWPTLLNTAAPSNGPSVRILFSQVIFIFQPSRRSEYERTQLKRQRALLLISTKTLNFYTSPLLIIETIFPSILVMSITSGNLNSTSKHPSYSKKESSGEHLIIKVRLQRRPNESFGFSVNRPLNTDGGCFIGKFNATIKKSFPKDLEMLT